MDAWRNCDRNVRGWCREHLGEVAADWVLFLEWDVLARGNLAAALGTPRRGVGLIGPAVTQGVRDRNWPTFTEVFRLPMEMQAGAIGIAPFAVCAIRVDVLSMICEERLPFRSTLVTFWMPRSSWAKLFTNSPFSLVMVL